MPQQALLTTINPANLNNIIQELSFLENFIRDNLASIGSQLTKPQKSKFWVYYQEIKLLHNEAILLSLHKHEDILEVSKQIRTAQMAIEKIIINYGNTVDLLNLVDEAIQLISTFKHPPANAETED